VVVWIDLGVEGSGGQTLPEERRGECDTLLPCKTTGGTNDSLVIGMPAVICLCRVAGGQCPLKGGQLTTTAAIGNWSIN
jgi:hypothetical protein